MNRISVVKPEYEILSGWGGFFRIEGEKGIGIMDNQGRILVEPENEDVRISPEDGPVEMFVCRNTERVGELESPVFSLVKPYHGVVTDFERGDCEGYREGIAVIKTEDGMECRGWSAGRAEVLLRLKGDHFKSSSYRALYHSGMLRVCNKLGFYHCYYDSRGHKCTGYYQMAGDFHDDLAAVAVERIFGYRYGMIDTQGRWVIKPQYEAIGNVQNHMVKVYKKGKIAFFNSQGTQNTPFMWDAASDFYERGYAFARSEEHLLACLVNRYGHKCTPLPDDCTWSRDISDELIAARRGDKWGYADLKGGWAIEPEFDSAGDFSKGVAPVERQGKWSFIDQDGAEVMAVEGKLRIVETGLAHTDKEVFCYKDK